MKSLKMKTIETILMIKLKSYGIDTNPFLYLMSPNSRCMEELLLIKVLNAYLQRIELTNFAEFKKEDVEWICELIKDYLKYT